MTRLPLFLLLIGVILGLTALPATAFATAMHAIAMTGMVKGDMAPMPDCRTESLKKASSAPCKCGAAGCIAITAAGIAMILPDYLSFAGASILSSLSRPTAPLANLRSRSTAPEPEPPSD